MSVLAPEVERAPFGSAPTESIPPASRSLSGGARRIRSYGADDWMSLLGAIAGSFALVDVAYNHILSLSGDVGFFLCWYAAFLVLYASVLSVTHPRPVVVDRLVSTALHLAGLVILFAVGSVVVYTFHRGWPAIAHSNFFTKTMAGVAPTAGFNQGGIQHAIVGTGIEIGLAVLISVPLGITTAVYMCEVGGRGVQLVRTVVEAMTALPEILAGLFVYAVLIVGFGLPKSGLPAAVAMAVTMIPITARAGEIALRVVPNGLREASNALGANHWRTVWKVVLPSARVGLVTGVILSIARGIGETAIVLVTSGASSFLTFNPTNAPMNSLPLFIYTAYISHEPTAMTRGFGAASVLLIIILVLFVLARLIVRQKAVSR